MKSFYVIILLCGWNVMLAQQTYVPDSLFEDYLETHDASGNVVSVGDPNSMGNGIANDNYVATANISSVTSINVNSVGISDLTGIEDFTSLQTLRCESNQLTSLDLSNNNNLEYLFCSYNQLSSLNISNNPLLSYLYCFSNQLSVIDVSNCLYLQQFLCGDNLLTSINVSANANIVQLNCANNLITSLDLKNDTSLQILFCQNNNLSVLDVRNGYNTNITQFYAVNNPNLTCILVDDTVWSNTNWSSGVDASASFAQAPFECMPVSVNNNVSNMKKESIRYDVNENILYIPQNLSVTEGVVYDCFGRVVLEFHSTHKQSLYPLSKGIYIIKIKTASHSIISKKIIIQ